jgi:death-on-curing protein
MRYLTIDEIIDINEEIIGAQSVVRDLGILDSAVARPQASAFGQDAYSTLLEKAAALMHSLILNHPFLDGNKSTATVAIVIFLNENGLRETWQTDDAHQFIIAIAEGKHDVPAIAAWLETNTVQE